MEQGLAELGLPEIPHSHQAVPSLSADQRQAYEHMLEICRTGRLGAVVVHSDAEAIAFMQHADDAGLRVPQDLAVVSYDDEVRPRPIRRSPRSVRQRPRSARWPWKCWRRAWSRGSPGPSTPQC